jgi:hypothetical protein
MAKKQNTTPEWPAAPSRQASQGEKSGSDVSLIISLLQRHAEFAKDVHTANSFASAALAAETLKASPHDEWVNRVVRPQWLVEHRHAAKAIFGQECETEECPTGVGITLHTYHWLCSRYSGLLVHVSENDPTKGKDGRSPRAEMIQTAFYYACGLGIDALDTLVDLYSVPPFTLAAMCEIEPCIPSKDLVFSRTVTLTKLWWVVTNGWAGYPPTEPARKGMLLAWHPGASVEEICDAVRIGLNRARYRAAPSPHKAPAKRKDTKSSDYAALFELYQIWVQQPYGTTPNSFAESIANGKGARIDVSSVWKNPPSAKTTITTKLTLAVKLFRPVGPDSITALPG